MPPFREMQARGPVLLDRLDASRPRQGEEPPRNEPRPRRPGPRLAAVLPKSVSSGLRTSRNPCFITCLRSQRNPRCGQGASGRDPLE